MAGHWLPQRTEPAGSKAAEGQCLVATDVADDFAFWCARFLQDGKLADTYGTAGWGFILTRRASSIESLRQVLRLDQ